MGRISAVKRELGSRSCPLRALGPQLDSGMGWGAPPPRDGQWRWRELQSRSSALPSSPLGNRERPQRTPTTFPNPSGFGKTHPFWEPGADCGLHFASRVSPLAGPPPTVLAVPGSLCSGSLPLTSPAGQPGTRGEPARSEVVAASASELAVPCLYLACRAPRVAACVLRAEIGCHRRWPPPHCDPSPPALVLSVAHWGQISLS